MFVKLDIDNETILAFDHISHDDITTPAPNGQYIITSGPNLGRYKYKLVVGELVELNQQELDDHPFSQEKVVDIILQLTSNKLSLETIIAHPQVLQKWKDRAQVMLARINQKLTDYLA